MKSGGRIYTAIFYVSLLITAVLISVMLLEPMREPKESPKQVEGIPHTQTGTSVVPSAATTAAVRSRTVEITEGDLKTLLSGLLKDAVGFEIDTLLITNDMVTILSKASKASIRERIAEAELDVGKALDVAMKIAPEDIEIDADIHLITNRTTQQIELTVTKLTVLGFKVPVSLLPDEFSDSISDFINSKRDEYGLRNLSVQLRNGKMILSGF